MGLLCTSTAVPCDAQQLHQEMQWHTTTVKHNQPLLDAQLLKEKV
jgi:hypothetical protein